MLYGHFGNHKFVSNAVDYKTSVDERSERNVCQKFFLEASVLKKFPSPTHSKESRVVIGYYM